MTDEAFDVIVVGGGGSGAPLAARLSENVDRRVLLLEAGPVPTSLAGYPPELLDVGTLRGAHPAHPNSWAHPAELAPGRDWMLARGLIAGGSTAVNGGYFVRALRSDFESWAAVVGPEWSWEACLPTLRSLENDSDFDGPQHGGAGPMPVARPLQRHPVTQAFANAADAAGLPLLADLNGDLASMGGPGYGPLPMNVRNGVRWNTALGYILPAAERPNLLVRGNAMVRKVKFTGTRATGVEFVDGSVVRGAEVVLAAGAIGTPQLLLTSGIGAGDALQRLGIAVVHDSPGVGSGFSDHPQLSIHWNAQGPLPPLTEGPTIASLVLLSSQSSKSMGEAADLEVLPLLKPLSYLLEGRDEHPERLVALVGLQSVRSRGSIELVSANPALPTRIKFGYLNDPADRERARDGVRGVVALLQSSAFGPLFGDLDPTYGLDSPTLNDDRALDRWAANSLGTAQHLSGSARMGDSSDAAAVADAHGRVHGVTGLRIADLSLLPTVPHRGPAATAVFIGERIAQFMLRD